MATPHLSRSAKVFVFPIMKCRNDFITMAEVGGATPSKVPPHLRTKNEVQADKLGLSASHLDLIIKMPMDKLFHFAEQRNFDEDQLNILRDIRRRGKNLIAAHNCRFRKLNEVEVDIRH